MAPYRRPSPAEVGAVSMTEGWSHTREVLETWSLPLHDEPRAFEELLEMVTDAQTEGLGRMRATGYVATATYAIEEVGLQDHLVIRLSYPGD